LCIRLSANSLKHDLGASVHYHRLPRTITDHDDAELARTHAKAHKIMADKGGDVLIWGRVKSDNALALHFTARSAHAVQKLRLSHEKQTVDRSKIPARDVPAF
jgi:hypothetical protein